MSEKSEITLETPTNLPANDGQGGEGGERLFAGKYKSVEELEKGYTELWKLHSSKGQPAANEAAGNGGTPANQGGEQKPTGKEIPTEETPPQNVAALDWNALESEYAESGTLSDETYADLEKKGFPRQAVDRYIAGAQAEVNAYDAAVYGAAGGQEQYASLIEWAKGSLEKDAKLAFNKAVQSGDKQIAALAVTGLKAQYEAANGRSGQLLHGKGGATGVKPFESAAEVTDAMRNPKYRNDPAYRKQVTERLAISKVFERV